jgi:hypothetical protein
MFTFRRQVAVNGRKVSPAADLESLKTLASLTLEVLDLNDGSSNGKPNSDPRRYTAFPFHPALVS